MYGQGGSKLKNRATITGLVLLFTLPILIAWYLVFFTDFNHGRGGYEHGDLVAPARQLPDKSLHDPLSGKTSSLHGKWTMLTVVNGNCEDICHENLYRMRQIRLAMGKEIGRLQRAVYFSQSKNNDELKSLFADYAGQLVLPNNEVDESFLDTLTVSGVENSGAICLVDPAGFYMMIYPYDTEPGGMIKDLKRLLRISKPG
ncbi:MAG TPA: hypothetical protein VJ981_07990 [Gammaproteobacteria bacterium]|nr:hypothetical protein [Gammaproteobacteria bacterium]